MLLIGQFAAGLASFLLRCNVVPLSTVGDEKFYPLRMLRKFSQKAENFYSKFYKLITRSYLR